MSLSSFLEFIHFFVGLTLPNQTDPSDIIESTDKVLEALESVPVNFGLQEEESKNDVERIAGMLVLLKNAIIQVNTNPKTDKRKQEKLIQKIDEFRCYSKIT